jgi:two-component system, chemotaxis family, protein-glutamate methylesterase/glutaminase
MAPDFSIVVIGASAGGVPALQACVASLPAELAAAVFVVLHVRADAVSRLPDILNRSGPLSAQEAEDGAKIRAGCIYVAKPDHHLLVDKNRVSVKKGPKENRFRPSIDALFRSAAYTHGPRVIGIVLSGALDDGTSGLWSIKRLGGTTIVQDPQQASFDSMPLSALEQVDVDYTLPTDEIGQKVARLIGEEARHTGHPPQDLIRQMQIETEVAASANAFKKGLIDFGEFTPLTCPECHGALVKLCEGSIVRYRCHTGHGFTASALLAGITEMIEPALWDVTRALEESVMLLDQIAQQLAEAGRSEESRRFHAKARETEKRAHALQGLSISHEHLSHDVLRGPSDDAE